MAEVDLKLEQRGLRNIAPGAIWIACAEHGLADLVEGSWVPRGWVSPTASGTKPDETPMTVATRAPTGPLLNATQRSQLDRIRKRIGLSDSGRVDGAVVSPPEQWRAAVDTAVTALRDEMNAVSRRRTLTDVQLRDGHVLAAGQTRAVMRFEVESDLVARDGMSAVLVADGVNTTVEVISFYGSSVTLALPAAAPQPAAAQLRCDLSWLLTEQIRRLGEVRDGAVRFDAAAALAAVTPGREDSRSLPDVSNRAGLNSAQSEAVERGLQPGVSWLWGPPGTGKTTTLAVLLTELFQRAERVLLVAPTNTAVDIALAGALSRITRFDEGDIVRVGQPVDQALVEREGGRVLIAEIAEGRGEVVASERQRLAKIIDQLRLRTKQLEKADQAGYSDEIAATALALAENQAMVRALDSLMLELRRQICQDALLVGATAHQLTMSTLRDMAFDVVVIDEASMMPAVLTMLAAGSGHGHTVIAGDFRQLPPVALADTNAAREWLHQSAFEKSAIAKDVLAGRRPGSLVALSEQHRMPAELANAISDGFYPENRLRTGASVQARARVLARADLGPIVAVDTSRLLTRVARRGGSTSRYNLMHAMIIRALLDEDDLIGVQPALITPFAAQARVLEGLLDEAGGTGLASTVHRFQGGENPAVVFDAVQSARGVAKLPPWFEDGSPGSEGARLVNVAASRAQERLVIVADLDAIYRRAERSDATRTFLKSALRDRDDLDARRLVGGTVTAHWALESLLDDVHRCQTDISIWSKHVAAGAARVLDSALRDAASRGCTVTLWFEPLQDGSVPDHLVELARTDVVLRPCLPVLESLAIVGDVVWAASDPLLAGGGGLTLRTEHAGLAAAVRKSTRRRRASGDPGSAGRPDRCGCGRLLARHESVAGPRAYCPTCDAGGGRWFTSARGVPAGAYTRKRYTS